LSQKSAVLAQPDTAWWCLKDLFLPLAVLSYRQRCEPLIIAGMPQSVQNPAIMGVVESIVM